MPPSIAQRSTDLPAGKVVLAGGTGFIGRHLVPALRRTGYDIVVLTRDPRRRKAEEGVRHVQWQPDADGAWLQELEGATALINLCGAGIGAGRWTPARKRALVASRTGPSRTLVAACNQFAERAPLILQASGVGYYGIGDADHVEQSSPGDDFLARLAVEWEGPLAESRARTVALRFGVVFGRAGGALPQMLLPFRLFLGGPVADGRQWLSWIHIDDAVRAILHVIERAETVSGAVNVTSPHPVRNADFARAAARALRRPALLRLPRWVLEAALGEQATLVCDGQRALPAKLLASGFGFRFPDLDAALADLAPP
jgi:uncharacterized protein